jgi:hypothetical protein
MNWAIDNWNYANDERTKGEAKAPVLYLDDGTEKELPMKWAVCGVCRGNGKHVNPSIDAGGISAEAFNEDPDFAEAYMDGTYDVTCNRCRGKRVVPAVDWGALTEDERKAYEAQERADWEYEQERLSEIRMGC